MRKKWEVGSEKRYSAIADRQADAARKDRVVRHSIDWISPSKSFIAFQRRQRRENCYACKGCELRNTYTRTDTACSFCCFLEAISRRIVMSSSSSSQRHAISGLAASIRKATESETFDLAGHSAATIEKQFHDAFAEPFSQLDNNNEMIRLTFVTGAGKLGRQKYDDGAAKAVTGTLRELGYREDRGASAVLECAGSFKLQHDTGKNLKTVVVFPKVVSANDVVSRGESNLGEGGSSKMLQEGTPQHKLAYSSMNVFGRMVETQCQTWSQKKACIEAIEELKGMIQSLDDKMMTGTPLTDSEQEFYGSVSMTSLEEKVTQVKEVMHKQVDTGKITSDERSMLLHQVGERIQTLQKEIAEGQQRAKPKRVENLTAVKQKAEDRRAKLQDIAPLPPPPLKNESSILKLRKELVPLEEVEAGAKNRLLTLKESQAVARKEEILQEIAVLEVSFVCRLSFRLLYGAHSLSTCGLAGS